MVLLREDSGILWEELIKVLEPAANYSDEAEDPNEDKGYLSDALGENVPVDKGLLDYFIVPEWD